MEKKKKKKNPKPPGSQPIKKTPFAPRLLPKATLLLDSRNARTRTQLLPFTPILSTLAIPLREACTCMRHAHIGTHIHIRESRNANLAFVAAHVRVRIQRASREVVDGGDTRQRGVGWGIHESKRPSRGVKGERRRRAEEGRGGGSGGRVVGVESSRVGGEQSVN